MEGQAAVVVGLPHLGRCWGLWTASHWGAWNHPSRHRHTPERYKHQQQQQQAEAAKGSTIIIVHNNRRLLLQSTYHHNEMKPGQRR